MISGEIITARIELRQDMQCWVVKRRDKMQLWIQESTECIGLHHDMQKLAVKRRDKIQWWVQEYLKIRLGFVGPILVIF